jgi:GNAT superfamily N-acetyltransferase
MQKFNPKAFDPDEPRDEQGRWSGDGGGDGGGSAKPAGEGGGKGKTKVSKVSDFNKQGIRLDPDTTIDNAKAEKFLARWNDTIGEAPEDFKNEFLGGMPATMRINYDADADKLEVRGDLRDEHGDAIGEYDRKLDLKNKSAYSAYFVMHREERGSGVGKKLLAANVALYQKLGFDKVTVSANIDVGGYAWARYGYVPTPASWRSLSAEIREKLGEDNERASHRSSGSGYTPESWDEIADHDQSSIETAWMRSTHNEFLDSEVQNWRDSGQALDDAKRHMSDVSDLSDEKWAQAALKEWRDGLSDKESEAIPFTNEQILAAVDIDEYSSRYDDGKSDPDIGIDWTKLTNESQPTLPGIPEAQPLTDERRDEVIKALQDGFNEEAESNAQDADPPSHIADSVSEYQEEYWSTMDDSDKFAWADRNGELPEYPLDDEDQDEEAPPVEASDPQRDALMKLASSSDPKALWAIADSSQGKSLLLNTSWAGVLDFKDKQTMDRFHAYVGKKG